MPPFPLPDLPTLDLPASWHNRARRTDRSACLELRCSEILPLCKPTAPRTPHAAFSHSHFTLTEPLLRHILRRRPPASPLAGSLRTAKSNALKTPPDQRLLALPPDWSCDLTILRCPLHARLTQHFFACPRCANRKSTITNRRFLKLFLILPTADEWRDAPRAARYLDAHRTALIRHGRFDLIARIIDRYAPLWGDRAFACRHCLDLRYGEVKPDTGRRHNPDLTPALRQRLTLTTTQRQSLAQLEHTLRELHTTLRNESHLRRLLKDFNIR